VTPSPLILDTFLGRRSGQHLGSTSKEFDSDRNPLIAGTAQARKDLQGEVSEADDFLCTLPDGTIVDRDRFLQHVAQSSTLGDLQSDDVNVRLMGDFAIIHARTTFILPDGTPGAGRYTDVWARREGRWLAVAAHVTRKGS
jgi:hypothetical protein